MRFKFALVVTLCALSMITRAQSVTYFDGDIYAALAEAQKSKKLLLVEFYAQWSYKSRWMNENVVTKCGELNDDFVVHKIDTRTVDGAKLASDYIVTDYPNILIFNTNGNVIDRIDKSLSIEDFRAKIASVIATTDGRNAWRLAQILESADKGDRGVADKMMGQYVQSNEPEFLTSEQNWPLFTNSDITFYGSVGYWFLKDNASLFPNAEKVNQVMEQVYVDAIMPYVIGNQNFDSVFVNAIAVDGEKFPTIGMLASLTRLRNDKDYFTYIQQLEKVINRMPEHYEYPLVMSLDFIADGVDGDHYKTVKREARNIVEKLLSTTTSPVKLSLIKALLDKFL